MSLSDLPAEEQQAIQQDKKLWLLAYKKDAYVRDPGLRVNRDSRRTEIRAWLESLPEAERDDMKRRLNHIMRNRSS